MDFVKLEREDELAIAAMSQLATAIIREYYDAIVGKEQNDYMLARFQSKAAIAAQLETGYRYYFVREGARDIGFFAFTSQQDVLYLSKFYLCAEVRGRGHGRRILDFLLEVARAEELIAIELNVNRHNETIYVYEALGFERIGFAKNDIGAGFFMDDYIYRLEVEKRGAHESEANR